jgi:16S rRNA (guanine527-N7)-methyltransferase
VLEEARQLGFLGPGPIESQIVHSLGFRHAITHPPDIAVDLGSGGGLPGLPLALLWEGSRWTLLDANVRRTTWLTGILPLVGLESRVTVLCQRAENAGRSGMRGQADLVVSRGFGRPAVTAECGAPLLVPGGSLVVSEPPGGQPGRWSPEGLSQLGLTPGLSISDPIGLQVLTLTHPCPDRYPRSVGKPSKRPLF